MLANISVYQHMHSTQGPCLCQGGCTVGGELSGITKIQGRVWEHGNPLQMERSNGRLQQPFCNLVPFSAHTFPPKKTQMLDKNVYKSSWRPINGWFLPMSVMIWWYSLRKWLKSSDCSLNSKKDPKIHRLVNLLLHWPPGWIVSSFKEEISIDVFIASA